MAAQNETQYKCDDLDEVFQIVSTVFETAAKDETPIVKILLTTGDEVKGNGE